MLVVDGRSGWPSPCDSSSYRYRLDPRLPSHYHHVLDAGSGILATMCFELESDKTGRNLESYLVDVPASHITFDIANAVGSIIDFHIDWHKSLSLERHSGLDNTTESSDLLESSTHSDTNHEYRILLVCNSNTTPATTISLHSICFPELAIWYIDRQTSFVFPVRRLLLYISPPVVFIPDRGIPSCPSMYKITIFSSF